VAARAAYGDPLTALADELEQERLDALDIDDPTTGVRHVFSWSLRSVSDAAAGLFVRLGLHPGPNFTVEAAASLVGLPVAEAWRALNELVAGSLVTSMPNGRFTQHDLLRDYAVERVGELPEEQRTEALHRMFDHYLHTALEVNQRRENKISWPPLAPPSPLVVVLPMPEVEEALAWEAAEHRVLRGVLEKMVAEGADDSAWRLGYTMHLYMLRRGRLSDAESVQLMALAAAQRLGSAFGQGRLHRSLSGVYIAKQAYDEAESQLISSLRYEVEMGNVNGRSNVSRGLAYVYERQGRPADALDILSRVHEVVDSLSPYERSCHLAALGSAHHAMGDVERAFELCSWAEREFVASGRFPTTPLVMNRQTLGRIHLRSGRAPEAVDAYSGAVLLMRKMQSDHDLPEGLVMLAKAYIAASEPAHAQKQLAEALALYEKSGRAEAAEVRELLVSVTNV
jgi:tetratricopeptide (TPR) repeat protein